MVNNIIKDKAGEFWLQLIGEGLFKYQPQSQKAVLIPSTKNITGISLAADGNIWCVFVDGMIEKMFLHFIIIRCFFTAQFMLTHWIRFKM